MAARLAVLTALAACAGACRPKPELADAQIVELTAVELEAELAAGTLTAERVTRVFLDRIAALDDAGPKLAAVIELNPDAIAIARALDARRGRAADGSAARSPDPAQSEYRHGRCARDERRLARARGSSRRRRCAARARGCAQPAP